MPHEENDLKYLETALAGLSPATARLDRDGLLHTAGRMAGERSARPWKMTTIALFGTVLALAAWTAFRRPTVVERVVVVPAPAEERTDTALESELPPSRLSAENELDSNARPALLSGSAQLEARWLILRFGPDALPNSAAQRSAGAGPPSRSLERDLGMPRDSFKGLADRRLNVSAGP